MSEWGGALKTVGDLGVMGVLLVAMLLLYRLADKWAPLFLAAQQSQTTAMAAQAAAMTSLASTVEKGQGDQREVLIAVRVLADRIDTQKGYLEAIERALREKGVAVD